MAVQQIKLDLLFQEKHNQKKEGTMISRLKTMNEKKQREKIVLTYQEFDEVGLPKIALNTAFFGYQLLIVSHTRCVTFYTMSVLSYQMSTFICDVKIRERPL